MTHELKILPRWFTDVQSGKKNFEIRVNDRDYKVGDTLILKEYYKGKYTGREITRKIQYIYQGDGAYGLSDEYCILGLEQEPKTGHWRPIYQGDEIINYRCSECEFGDTNGSTNLYGWDYCRRCGAKMSENPTGSD